MIYQIDNIVNIANVTNNMVPAIHPFSIRLYGSVRNPDPTIVFNRLNTATPNVIVPSNVSILGFYSST